MAMHAKHSYLRRLPPESYRGQAYVHWSMSIEDRKQGWLIPIFYYKFREILTHTMFRHRLCCPLYCCMPDHFHLIWIGTHANADQRVAAKYFRAQINPILEKLGVRLQKQCHDHVLSEDQREHQAFESVAEYIARNPERQGIVAVDSFRSYPFSGCLVPGYPELTPWQPDYWLRFWRIYSNLCTAGVHPGNDSSSKSP